MFLRRTQRESATNIEETFEGVPIQPMTQIFPQHTCNNPNLPLERAQEPNPSQ